MATTSTVGNLNSYFTNIISDIMLQESQPLTQLQNERDTITTKTAVYADMGDKLKELQTQVKSMISTNGVSSMNTGRSVTVTPADTTKKVVTATATSAAVAGIYKLNVTALAQAERQASVVMPSSNLPLSKSGILWLGGTGTASILPVHNSTVNSAATTQVATGQRELGKGAYNLETRTQNGVLQFRLTDVDGNAIAIAKTVADGSTTTDWQKLTAGDFDTGRGIKLNLTGVAADAKTTINYTAAGVSVNIAATDSLVDMANKINSVRQPEGRDLTAAVIGSQLIFTAAQTGLQHKMIYSTANGLDLGTFSSNQLASDAAFTVNGIDFTRQSNTNITNAVYGLTLNLTDDAKDNQATITVVNDTTSAKSAINTFVTLFNGVVNYIADKSDISKDETGAYTRGALADDTIFDDLRGNLLSSFFTDVSSSGSYKNLRDIGLVIGDDLTASVEDADKLNKALTSNPEDVTNLLNQVMGNMNNLLGRFTGSTGYINSAKSLLSQQVTDANTEIADKNTYLSEKQQFLIDEYSQMQTLLMQMSYTQQMYSSMLGGSSLSG